VIERLFGVARAGSTVRTEVLAGVTTFVTMAYILVVNPAILEAAGVPKGPSFTATAIVAVFGTLLMGFLANRPFAVAPYMGENAFIAFTVVGSMGLAWGQAMAATFAAGVLFLLLTVTHVRRWLADALPNSLKAAFAVGIGLFLSLIGLSQMGVVALGQPGGALLRLGDLSQGPTILSLVGFLAMAIAVQRRMPGGILVVILALAVAMFGLGWAAPPTTFTSPPPSPAPIMMQLDFSNWASVAFLQVVLVVFVMAFLDTMGTLLGLAQRAGMLDENGNLPDVQKPLLVDASATTLAPLVGTTVSGAYIESAAGIESGGRTGLTAVTTGLLFLLAMVFAPVLTAIPAHAYAPALVLVGVFMVSAAKHLPFDKTEELVPAFTVVALISFTYNIGIGMAAGFVVYPVTMLAAGRGKDLNVGVWAMFVLCLGFFLVSARGH